MRESIERDKERIEQEKKDLQLKLYQFKEQNRKAEQGESLCRLIHTIV